MVTTTLSLCIFIYSQRFNTYISSMSNVNCENNDTKATKAIRDVNLLNV